MADGADPLISVRRVDPVPLAITSPNQTFFIFLIAGANSAAFFAFQNDTAQTLTSLTLNLAAGLTYNCDPTFQSADIFSTCSTSSGPVGSTIVTFSGVGGAFTGLDAASCTPNTSGDGDDDWDDKPSCTGGIFSIEFFNTSNSPVVIIGTGTVSAPEPMTAVLLFSGLVGLADFASGVSHNSRFNDYP